MVAEAPLVLKANLGSRMLVVQRADSTLKTFAVAIGQDGYPIPVGTFSIRKIVWNPSWKPPPGADWAKGKTAKGPGDPGKPDEGREDLLSGARLLHPRNRMPVESLGSAASHGCLRMHPEEVADLAKLIMEHGGQPREEEG